MKIFIYTLSHPTTNEIRYVGKTGNLKNRLTSHLSASKSSNSHVGRWIKSILPIGLPIIDIIEECDENSWEEREIYWISFYKEQGLNLCNIQKGGNQPISSIKNKGKGYSLDSKTGKFKAQYCENNTIHYLGLFNTKEEAIQAYKTHTSNKKYNKGVSVFKDGQRYKDFKSIALCAKELQTSGTNISRCVKGKAKSHKGYTFKSII